MGPQPLWASMLPRRLVERARCRCVAVCCARDRPELSLLSLPQVNREGTTQAQRDKEFFELMRKVGQHHVSAQAV